MRIDEPTGNNELGSLDAPNQPTFYKYNPQGKMVKVSQGQQNRYFLYDYLGRLIRVKQPEQEVNSALDLTDTVTNNNQWTAGFEYDIVGNLKKTTDAKGSIITNSYDKAGRVTLRSYSNEPQGVTTPNVEYFYDGKGITTPQTPNYAKGKLTKVTSSISETRYNSFDNFGRLLQMEQRTPFDTETIANATPRVSSYQYDFGGRLVAETYPSGRVVKNEFNIDGDLSRVASKANATATERLYANSFSFTASGGIEKMRLGNGKFETAKFNNRLQITELGLGHSATDASLWKVNYEYGELENGSININKNTGNIARQTLSFAGLTNPIVQSYKYDSLDRLTEAKETLGTGVNAPENWNQTWNYDRFGNRIAFSQNVNGQQLAINSATLPSVNANTNRFNLGQGFAYDKNGNIVSDAVNNGRSFEFDAENKQTKVFNSSGGEVGKYYYDGEGKRVKKVAGNETTIFVYSSGKLIAEYSTQTATTPTISYTTSDHLGSPRVITDASGKVKSRRDFMPFGEEIGLNTAQTPNRASIPQYGAGDNVRQKFTGYQKDNETNLDFAEARYYNNQHGRFTAVDPLLASGKSSNPQTFNRYVYVGNSPLTRVDMTGLIWGISGTKVNWFKSVTSMKNAGYETFKPKDWTYQGVGNVTVRLNPKTGRATVIPNAVPGDRKEVKPIPLTAPQREMVNSFADQSYAKQHAVETGLKVAVPAGIIGGACLALCGLVLAATSLEYAATHPNEVHRAAQAATIEAENLLSNPRVTNGVGNAMDKLTRYLLNYENTNGGSQKAKWFEQALGFTQKNAQALADQIVFNPNTAVQTQVIEQGTKYNQTIQIVGANGKVIDVVFGFIRLNDGTVNVVTAIPTPR